MPLGTYTPNVHAGDGVAGSYAYNFKIFADADLRVKIAGVVKTLTTHYTVTGAGSDSGGTVVPVNPADFLGEVVIESNIALSRSEDYQRNGSFDERTVDRDFDRRVRQIQQIGAAALRAIKAPASVLVDQVISDADWAGRAGKIVGYDDSGNVSLFSSSDLDGVLVSTFAETLLDDTSATSARSTLGLADGSAELSLARVSIGRTGSDPFGYETPLLVVSNNNEDNVVTLRAQDSNVNGHTAIRLQDYAGAERGAVGLGGDYTANPFRYSVFMEGGNIAGNYGSKDTSVMLGVTHSGNPNISNAFIPRLLIVPSAYNGSVDSGGWTRIGTENRGVAVNAIIITRGGRVGIGPSITQSDYPNNNGGSDPAVSSILTVNGSTYIDPDNLAGSMANSTDLVVVRSSGTARSSIRVGVDGVGSIDVGMAGGNGALGVDGSIKMVFKTGITGGNLTTGTERMRLDAGILLLGTTTNTNAANGDARLNGALWIKDGMTAPTNAAGFAAIYVDTADGDLKVKFDDGTTKTIATDT